MPAERRQLAAAAFWSDENAGQEQAEVLAVVAQRIKFRPKSVIALPKAKKAQYLLGLPAVSELVAARLLVAYHLAEQRPMMAAFLDALGIAHEDGLIADDEITAPEPETLRKAAATLASAYPPDEVALYLSTLLWQDTETWGGLVDAPEARLPGEA